MSYTITKTDGTILLTIPEGKVDKISTSLDLIGKNVNSYGEFINNDLVRLLENFATANEEPRAPLVGQLWYNKADGRLNAFDGVQFKPVGSTIISATEPLSFTSGDLWIDTKREQLYFSPDATKFLLLGPQYTKQNGKSGWLTESVTAFDNTQRIVACLYNNGVLLATASSSTFSLIDPYPTSATYQINVISKGIALNDSIPGIRFVGAATTADAIDGISPGDYILNNQVLGQTMIGPLSISNDEGIYLGALQDISIQADGVHAYINSNITSKGLKIRGENAGYFTAIQIDSTNKRVGILTDTPSEKFDVNAPAKIRQQLTVLQTATVYDLHVNTSSISIGTGQITPSDSFIEGGGLKLIGTTDHTLSYTANSGGCWNINDNINLDSGKEYKINGSTIINQLTLGDSIISAPGLTTLGTLAYLTVSNILIDGTTIWATGTNDTLNLRTAIGAGTINVGNHKITSVTTCTDGTDAANKDYVDFAVLTRFVKGFSFTIDITNINDPNTYVIKHLRLLHPITNIGYPQFNLDNGTRARVLCSSSTFYVSAQTLNINKSTTIINGNSVVTDVAGTLPAFSTVPTVTYSIKEFIVSSGDWVWTADISIPP